MKGKIIALILDARVEMIEQSLGFLRDEGLCTPTMEVIKTEFAKLHEALSVLLERESCDEKIVPNKNLYRLIERLDHGFRGMEAGLNEMSKPHGPADNVLFYMMPLVKGHLRIICRISQEMKKEIKNCLRRETANGE